VNIYIVNLLLAHFLAEFVFPGNTWREVTDCKHRLKQCVTHFIIVGLCVWCVIGVWGCWWLASLAAIVHVLIDLLPRWVKQNRNNHPFFVVQVGHLIVIAIVLYIINKYGIEHSWYHTYTDKLLLYSAYATALVFCIWPANNLIREIIQYCRIKDDINRRGAPFPHPESVKQSGALIGSIERILVFILIMLGGYEAAGLIIAAKSLLRFNDNEGPRTEYVLAGTLLSLLIALLCALFVKFIILHSP